MYRYGICKSSVDLGRALWLGRKNAAQQHMCTMPSVRCSSKELRDWLWLVQLIG